MTAVPLLEPLGRPARRLRPRRVRQTPLRGLRPVRCAEPGCPFVFWTNEPDAAVLTALIREHYNEDHDREEIDDA